jgi:serine/threonine-protein kinase
MLTGRVPFHSDTPLGYVRKHMLEEPPPFRAVAPGLPVSPQVEATVMKALAKDREQRYPSTLDFARDFARAASSPSEGESRAPLATTKLIQPGTPGRESGGTQDREALPQPALPADRQPDVAIKTPSPREESPAPALPLNLRGGGGSRTAPTIAPTAPKPGKAIRYVGLGALIMLVAAGAIWYRSHSVKQRAQKQQVPPGPSVEFAGLTPSKRKAQAEIQQAPPEPASSAPPGMVYIPGGTFTMGRDNAPNAEESPAHSVTVAPFFIDKEPVTKAQYRRFVSETRKYTIPVSRSDSGWPFTYVSWQGAQDYCGWAVPGGRLPTEAEWEFAARGTDGRLYPWGNSFSSALANSLETGLGHPEPVGLRPKNVSPFGVLDMSGNVWEWCADAFKPYAGQSSGFAVPEDAKVIRGGSFKSDQEHVTTTTRNLDHASILSPIIGFRCAKSRLQ